MEIYIYRHLYVVFQSRVSLSPSTGPKNGVEVGGVVVGMMNFVGNPLDSMA
jgi:hypothetical protein